MKDNNNRKIISEGEDGKKSDDDTHKAIRIIITIMTDEDNTIKNSIHTH